MEINQRVDMLRVITRDTTTGAMMTGDMTIEDMIAEEMIEKDIPESMIKRIRTGRIVIDIEGLNKKLLTAL